MKRPDGCDGLECQQIGKVVFTYNLESRSEKLFKNSAITASSVDFLSPAFRDYQESLRDIVEKPNLDDADENTKRRALLFIRHLALWKEIPIGPNGMKWKSKKRISARLESFRAPNGGSWRAAISQSLKLQRACAYAST